MATRNNQWFVPGDGIAREVITADIQRYLGPDALVRPGVGTGEYEGRQGYWITAYRTLTTQMILDLRLDSQRWQQERGGGGVAYEASRTHASRQHYGPSEYASTAQQQPKQAAYQPQAGYGGEQGNYTTAPVTGYGTAYQAHQGQPRTYQEQYPQQAGQRTDYPYTYSQPAPSYPAHAAQSAPTDPYGRSTAPYQPTQSSTVARPGYYIASDGREYPMPAQQQQQQQQQQQPHNPRRRA